MTDLLTKLSSYNLFNYLLPGALFVAAMERMSSWRFEHDNIVVALFVYYFLGLVISRLGSLVLSPAFERVGLVKPAPYGDFLRACKADEKIDILSEQNNMFRTLCALCIAIPIAVGADAVTKYLDLSHRANGLVASVLLFVLFAAACRKQTSFIARRVAERLK